MQFAFERLSPEHRFEFMADTIVLQATMRVRRPMCMPQSPRVVEIAWTFHAVGQAYCGPASMLQPNSAS